MSRLYVLLSLRNDFDHLLTSFQTNILVGDDGRVRIAGLGAASVPSTATADVDRSFHGAAPGLINPQRYGLINTRATTASDVYAFAILAWGVRMKFASSLYQSLIEMGSVIRCSPGDIHFLTRALSQEFTRCGVGADRLGPTILNSLIVCGR